MGRHKEWRKIAKRERRRRIRTRKAKDRDRKLDVTSEEYKQWIFEQELLEKFELQQIELSNMEENEKWLKAEEKAIEKYNRIALERDIQQRKKIEMEIMLQKERELEKQRKAKEEEMLKEIEEKHRLKQEMFIKSLEKFLAGDSSVPPVELLIYRESRPNLELCPFFFKTACCRFADECSRNHQYPGISTTLLATNFYAHFGLENAIVNEYDSDVMLEYEDSDTYKHFKEFFYDVLPEFQKYGQVIQFKVCNNFERHLRGNTYIEYADIRSAVQAYRALHARWYGGKQISLQFCNIYSWKRAICGLEIRKRCPKGNACNFLHVFTNPGGLYNDIECYPERRRKSPNRSWRWSESPEKEPRRRKRSESRERESRRKDIEEGRRRRSKQRRRSEKL
ncbi:U2 small nuclear ribonucleoprotein auxiliary factor 35 kDa subunit-related protein 2 [Zerene cesonia]|uniref:U2 small nuclear ribonucleoprotein auxiliary factor 35 kDa subunit-related protein 2 n=1 Tax=Zerene cesonia TaxID=33412 RepID=UPI0018E5A52B|nr:U2 small nuclear ribonucleoprotein auxiliary factor 35 kDa subunit-related protein 2 [Zerene cesonia]